MGTCAELIAIGPFSPAIAAFLDYPAVWFANTRRGVMVSQRLFGIEEGSTASRELAALLGISDPWDFSQHAVVAASIDRPGLAAFARTYPDYADDVFDRKGNDEWR